MDGEQVISRREAGKVELVGSSQEGCAGVVVGVEGGGCGGGEGGGVVGWQGGVGWEAQG